MHRHHIYCHWSRARIYKGQLIFHCTSHLIGGSCVQPEETQGSRETPWVLPAPCLHTTHAWCDVMRMCNVVTSGKNVPPARKCLLEAAKRSPWGYGEVADGNCHKTANPKTAPKKGRLSHARRNRANTNEKTIKKTTAKNKEQKSSRKLLKTHIYLLNRNNTCVSENLSS